MVKNISTVINCTACGSCINICPKKCISFSLNNVGEKTPVVDHNRCVQCGKCRVVCQKITNPEYNTAISTFAYKTNNSSFKKCSSGGLVYDLSRNFIKQNGYVVGATWNLNNECELKVSNSPDDLALFCGSKYVHSDARKIYQRIEMLLKEKTRVLMVGLPCQVAGLKLYLSAKLDKTILDNYLFSIDLVCHGTPPMFYLRKYVKELKIRTYDDIKFRGENDFFITIFNRGKIIYKSYKAFDYYFAAFLNSITYRSNCYSCDFCSTKRIGDITAGDFWGLNKNEVNLKGNISLCVVNTAKGIELLDSLNNCGIIVKRDIEEAVVHNAQLLAPANRTKDADIFKKNIMRHTFKYSLLKTKVGRKIFRDRLHEKRNNLFRRIGK